jgi:predicted NUDIX family phosphoesterase
MHSNEMQTDTLHSPPDEAGEREHQTYLRVAEIVLASALSPLKAREIVERGIERGLFGDHVLSRTPEKSMQARLSMDILNRASKSKFLRTERGRFELRAKLYNAANTTITEYVAEKRVLRTPKEEVLCSSENAFGQVLTFQGIDTDSAPLLGRLLRDNSAKYISRSEAEARNGAKQFVTYVLVQCGQRLLFFKRSYLSRAAEFLRGSKCIGFGGHVSEADFDMLSLDDQGISACARRELMEELFLPDEEIEPVSTSQSTMPANARIPTRATVRLFQNAPLERIGILNDDSSEVGRRHVAVVYRVWLPDWQSVRHLQKGDPSIKGLGWIDLSKDKLDIANFEYWSQLCLRKFYPSTVTARSSIRILNKAKLASDRVIVVAGRIGSGKTETASYLSQELGWPLIKSSVLLQKLMGTAPMSEIGRQEFQTKAFDFIRSAGGPERLAASIYASVNEMGAARCVVDGIRNLSTYENLLTRFPESVGLIFVQTPPDVAYEMHRAREVQGALTFSYREFLEVYDAPVEAEISSLGRKAQVYIYNSFGMEAFRRTLDIVALRLVGQEPAEELLVTSPEKVRARYPSGAA